MQHPAAGQRLHVLTLNVFSGTGTAGKDLGQLTAQISAVAAVDASTPLDVIALQEAWEPAVVARYAHRFRKTHTLVRCDTMSPKLGAAVSPVCCAGTACIAVAVCHAFLPRISQQAMVGVLALMALVLTMRGVDPLCLAMQAGLQLCGQKLLLAWLCGDALGLCFLLRQHGAGQSQHVRSVTQVQGRAFATQARQWTLAGLLECCVLSRGLLW